MFSKKDTKSPDYDPYAGHTKEQRAKRRDVRYKLFQLRNYELRMAAYEVDNLAYTMANDDGDIVKPKEPTEPFDRDGKAITKSFIESYEKQDVFKVTNGFSDFTVKWDVDPKNPKNIRSLEKSAEQEWDEHCEEVAKPLPSEKDEEAEDE